MRTVTFIFSVCLLLFAASFVACEADKDRTDGPFYEDTMKNSMNQFLTRRYQSRRRIRGAAAMDTVNLDQISILWNASNGFCIVIMNNTTLTISPYYDVTGVTFKGHRNVSAISLMIDFTIPEAVIDNVTWTIIGTWRREKINGKVQCPIVYRNISARIQIDVKLMKEDGENYWYLTDTRIDTDDAFLGDPVEHVPLQDKIPIDIPFRTMHTHLKRSIADQVEPKLSTVFNEFFRRCPWKCIMVGRF